MDRVQVSGERCLVLRTDTNVIPQSDAVADPDGVDEDGSGLLALFGMSLIEA